MLFLRRKKRNDKKRKVCSDGDARRSTLSRTTVLWKQKMGGGAGNMVVIALFVVFISDHPTPVYPGLNMAQFVQVGDMTERSCQPDAYVRYDRVRTSRLDLCSMYIYVKYKTRPVMIACGVPHSRI